MPVSLALRPVSCWRSRHRAQCSISSISYSGLSRKTILTSSSNHRPFSVSSRLVVRMRSMTSPTVTSASTGGSDVTSDSGGGGGFRKRRAQGSEVDVLTTHPAGRGRRERDLVFVRLDLWWKCLAHRCPLVDPQFWSGTLKRFTFMYCTGSGLVGGGLGDEHGQQQADASGTENESRVGGVVVDALVEPVVVIGGGQRIEAHRRREQGDCG